VEHQIKSALENTLQGEAWVAFQSTGSVPIPALQIVVPAPNTAFIIDDTPRMPTIEVVVKGTGITPDPTATTTFDWSAELSHNPRTAGDRNGQSQFFYPSLEPPLGGASPSHSLPIPPVTSLSSRRQAV
jgi:hypothetical protein